MHRANMPAPIHTERPDCAVTDHAFSQMVMAAFAQGCGGKLVEPAKAGPDVAVYGILRGCGEAMQRADNYYYIDHGFFSRAEPSKGDGYYRVLKNRQWPASVPDGDWSRFLKLNVPLKDMRTRGSHIVVVPPSAVMAPFLGLSGWLECTLPALDALTDRPIIVSEKGGAPASSLFRGAWCVITEHSQVAIDALIEGIPAIMLSDQRRLGSLAEIENPPMSRAFFSTLANNQFTLDEMKSGDCWAALTRA